MVCFLAASENVRMDLDADVVTCRPQWWWRFGLWRCATAGARLAGFAELCP